jgi:uncharacterized protein (TIGR02646 family)
MLKINCPPLQRNLQAYLDKQRQGDKPWNSLSVPQAARQIKSALQQAFHDKCGYCETVEAQTVDHFWPQRTSPQKRWDWDNFILACNTCQSKKLENPPVDEQGNQMVNPRHDEPLHFLYFDFWTGMVTPFLASEETAARGRLTIERLALDRRPTLEEERRRKFWDVMGYVARIVQPKSAADAEDAWRQLVDHLRPGAPYLGMIRQLFLRDNDYTPLIVELRRIRPEFDEVIRAWCLPLQDD